MVDYKHPVNPGLIGSRWHDPKRKHLHMGTDYKEGTGNFVRAIADGVVRVVNQHRLWGFHVQIEHADGRISSYHQLQRNGRPLVGTRLRQGDIVGRVGNPLIGWSQAEKEKTGIWSGQVERDSSGALVSTGPHLHLGILEGYGKPWINPESVITTKATATAPAGGGTTPINPKPEEDMSLTPLQDERLRIVADLLTAGTPGVSNDGDILARLKRLEGKVDGVAAKPAGGLTAIQDKRLQVTADSLTAGTPGVSFDGDILARLKRIETNSAASVDVKKLAAELVAQLPKADAEALVDAIAARLAK